MPKNTEPVTFLVKPGAQRLSVGHKRTARHGGRGHNILHMFADSWSTDYGAAWRAQLFEIVPERY